MSNVTSHKMLDAVIATGSSGVEMFNGGRLKNSFFAYGTTSAGAGAATILIEVSDKDSPSNATNVDWVIAGTITLVLGTTQTNDGFVTDAAWRWVRARVSAISGTDGTVTVLRGV
jgi:hypothetical protein